MIAALRRWRDEEGDVAMLGLARVAFGLLLGWNAVRAARELARGYFGDVFHWPLVPEVLVPSRAVYTIVVAAQLVLALLVVAGRWRAREALFASAVLGTYVLLCDRLQFHHNRWALFCQALLLSLAPCDRSFRLAPRLPGVGPLWAARLVGLQLSIIYAASAGSKLLDPDWRSGVVLLERFHLYASQAIAAGVPEHLMNVLSQPAAASVLAKGAIATELFLAVGLWSTRTRVFALCWGTCFHLIIEATSRVEGFTWLVLASYLVFVPRMRWPSGGAATRHHWWSVS
ncbi:MAG TPA: HTTM domain-containing protein [Polyangiaceae bacterium]|nr:HTTM domain-containing protein [Polyangiaceae bacterium]